MRRPMNHLVLKQVKLEEVVHEEDRNSLPSDSKKDEDTSHEYEEVSIENIEKGHYSGIRE